MALLLHITRRPVAKALQIHLTRKSNETLVPRMPSRREVNTLLLTLKLKVLVIYVVILSNILYCFTGTADPASVNNHHKKDPNGKGFLISSVC